MGADLSAYLQRYEDDEPEPYTRRETPRDDEPEIMLFAEIIRCAVKDAVSGAPVSQGRRYGGHPATQEQSKEEAFNWFFSARFEHYCQLLNCDPAVVRQRPLETIARNRDRKAPGKQIDW